jgi:hypothetical protein
VPPRPWSRAPLEVLQRGQASADEGGALTLWAAWCVEALDYAVELDDEFFGQSQTRDFRPDAIDLAHVRWSAGTGSTAIDLCAAALGSWHCGVHRGAHQLDLRMIRPRAKDRTGAKDKSVERRRKALPAAAKAWVRRTWVDPQYKTLLAVRNPFTHARLPRIVALGTTGHQGRTAFRIQHTRGSTSQELDSRELVLLARDVARRHVQEFLDQLDARHLGPAAHKK